VNEEEAASGITVILHIMVQARGEHLFIRRWSRLSYNGVKQRNNYVSHYTRGVGYRALYSTPLYQSILFDLDLGICVILGPTQANRISLQLGADWIRGRKNCCDIVDVADVVGWVVVKKVIDPIISLRM
ncbi:3667_t:CDS:2, partial [Paraglomus occultum]